MDTWETQLWMTSRSCVVSAPHQATVILRWTLVATVTREQEMTLIGRGVQAQHWRPTQDPQWTTQQDQTEVCVYKPCVYQLNHQLSFTVFQRTMQALARSNIKVFIRLSVILTLDCTEFWFASLTCRILHVHWVNWTKPWPESLVLQPVLPSKQQLLYYLLVQHEWTQWVIFFNRSVSDF